MSNRNITKVGLVLLAAADYIEKHGHLKGRNGGFNGAPACAVGAMSATSMTVGTFNKVASHFSKYLVHCTGKKFETIGDWNDAPERTADEVIHALRAAASWRAPT